MKAFICPKRPRSVNASGCKTFKGFIRDACQKYCGGELLEGLLYGRVYYFRNVAHQLDADNLSKPILDALKGLVFQDDASVRLRHSGIIDLTQDDIAGFDITRMPDCVLTDFLSAIGSEDHLIYVEIGPLTKSMFAFGSSKETSHEN